MRISSVMVSGCDSVVPAMLLVVSWCCGRDGRLGSGSRIGDAAGFCSVDDLSTEDLKMLNFEINSRSVR